MHNKNITSENLKDIIISESIVFIDFRCICNGNNKNIKSIIFSAVNFDCEIIERNRIKINTHFIDPFLAHKTLTIFIENTIDDLPMGKPLQCIYFKILNNSNMENDHIYAPPPLDAHRDIRGEIIIALQSIGIKVLYNYYLGENKHYIAWEKYNQQENIQTNFHIVQYAAYMVAKAYNINLEIIY
jgi:hypothetical protein